MQRVQYEMKSLYDKDSNMYNVGCMMTYMDYTPRTLEEIIGQASLEFSSKYTDNESEQPVLQSAT